MSKIKSVQGVAKFFPACFGLGRLLLVILAGGFAMPGWSDTLIVTNTANSGPGSFQQALLTANTNPGVDTIVFQISGAPPFTITLTNALPQISEAVVIDATTQPGFVGKPVIELNGLSAGAGAVGLKFGSSASFSTVRGLVINRFNGSGIELNSASNTIAGNYIGTDATGGVARGNGLAGSSYGLFVKSAGNYIGGTNAADRNVISGNNDAGIYILTAGGNTVRGNWIGVNATNSAVGLGNISHGIVIYNSAGNLIGGTNAGEGNVISGNTSGASGVFLDYAGATGNWIQGNRIGMDATGSTTVSNAGDGITLYSAPGNWIGPSNLISGNSLAGVSIQGASNNVITGNFIGTDVTGNLARPNYSAGVSVSGASGNQIGGTNAGDGNLISGNTYHGIQLLTSSTVFTKGTVIQGNLIGVNASGTSALRNGYQGIFLSGASSNLIGGPVAGARNIISGNASNGVFIANLTDTSNFVQGNFIGTDVTGHNAIANGLDGIHLQACANLIGGTTQGSRNVISGNANLGVYLVGTGGNVTGNIIQGNYIGLDATGNPSLPNSYGLGISDAATNQIGGTATGAGNVISGNRYYGIFLTVTGSAGNQIQGNLIGIDATGTLPQGNGSCGIYSQNAGGSLIGGGTSGAGNVVSASGAQGIYFVNSSRNIIQGNYVGTDVLGTNDLGNSFAALECDATSSNNTIGGTNGLAGNRLAYSKPIGSPRAGIRIRDGAINNLISGNAIFSNTSLGIDLGGFMVNPNLPCESSASPANANLAQNYPVITNVVSGANTRIRGYLDSGINKTYRLQFFAGPTANASGYYEGQVFLGQQTFVLAGNCTNYFSFTLPVSVPVGWIVTVTATDSANNTSEFSTNYVYTTNLPPVKICSVGLNQQSVSWTNIVGPLTLQRTYALSPPIAWGTVTNTPVLNNGIYSVTLTTTNQNVFYRLLMP